jgi:hypothetical protein
VVQIPVGDGRTPIVPAAVDTTRAQSISRTANLSQVSPACSATIVKVPGQPCKAMLYSCNCTVENLRLLFVLPFSVGNISYRFTWVGCIQSSPSAIGRDSQLNASINPNESIPRSQVLSRFASILDGINEDFGKGVVIAATQVSKKLYNNKDYLKETHPARHR